MAIDHKNTPEPYTVVRNAWTNKLTYTCNTCGETDFRSEHAARFHICEPPAPPPAQQPKSHVTHEKIKEIFDSYGQYLSGKDLAMLRVIELMLKENK